MGWDSDLPATDQKLRTLAGTIVPNWKAIEEADETSGTPIFQRAILLADRTAVASAADPVVVGATTYVYSKQDGDSVQELYMRDAASNAVQCSQGGRLGSDTTNIGFDSLSHDKGTTTYDELNLITAWGTFTATTGGTIKATPGLTSSSESGGVYSIAISPVLDSATNYGILLTCEDQGSNPATGVWKNKTASGFDIIFRNQNGTATASVDFTVMIVGGR
jgi:hypothetical protein